MDHKPNVLEDVKGSMQKATDDRITGNYQYHNLDIAVQSKRETACMLVLGQGYNENELPFVHANVIMSVSGSDETLRCVTNMKVSDASM
jgi:hypothetical protein